MVVVVQSLQKGISECNWNLLIFLKIIILNDKTHLAMKNLQIHIMLFMDPNNDSNDNNGNKDIDGNDNNDDCENNDNNNNTNNNDSDYNNGGNNDESNYNNNNDSIDDGNDDDWTNLIDVGR